MLENISKPQGRGFCLKKKKLHKINRIKTLSKLKELSELFHNTESIKDKMLEMNSNLE